MKVSDFDYDLPEELIAQDPLADRSSSRLMHLDRSSGTVSHHVFSEITDFLKKGDCLVINNTKVIPARLYGHRESGGQVELLLLKRQEEQAGAAEAKSGDPDALQPDAAEQGSGGRDTPQTGGGAERQGCNSCVWECLSRPGKKCRPGTKLFFGNGELAAEILAVMEDGNRLVKFSYQGIFEEVLDALGEMPLPPYITHKLADRSRYQTVYAKYDGSAAAPTAGLHFTKELLEEVRAKGVSIAEITLHVGLGTFRPVKAEDTDEHVMHSEYYEISPEAAELINATKAAGGRVIAVGTTSTRTLEAAAQAMISGKAVPHPGETKEVSAGDAQPKETKEASAGDAQPKETKEASAGARTAAGDVLPAEGTSGWTDIFIRPGYTFRVIDGLITNFHLPKSTLVMLVSAFAGREEVLSAYAKAVKERYRFFSFGDAMLIL